MMETYEIVDLNAAGEIIGTQAFECNDNSSALKMAREMIGEHAVEVWHRGRRIARFASAYPAANRRPIR